jgi:alpha-tubulin suppressor-like RCC1 family protein
MVRFGIDKASEDPDEKREGEFITKISAGGSHSVAASANGYVYCWGRGKEGRLVVFPLYLSETHFCF